MTARPFAVSLFLAGTALTAGACGRPEGQETGAVRSAAGAPAAAAGRSAPALTLAASDVAVVRRALMVDGVPITGTLRPIETIDVRSRVDGVIQGVYVREGDHVRQGQLLAAFEATEQASSHQSALADRAAARTELSTAEWNLEQTEELFKAGAVAEREARAARSAVTTARARLAAAEARVRSTALTSRDTRVLAPTTGTVEKRLVEGGEHMARGAQLFTVVRNDVLELAAAVPERRAAALAVGQPVTFVAAGRQFEGRVARLSPTIDPSSRAITVYVRAANADGSLRGGTFATGAVLVRSVSDALVVPATAVRQTVGGNQIAYRIRQGAVDTTGIQVGIVDDRTGTAEIITGLSEGDSVVAGNVGGISRGMRVDIRAQ